ncbi:MAG: NAD-dependent epimerase/dehydratase family protein [Actinobacteria bacterium]|nr:MAG: NAD-dependent epimerase/dehydratase family protein [Actinomycetota bacterium]
MGSGSESVTEGHRSRALVTGGAGFIGSHLCERLLDDGWIVTAIDNLSTGRGRNIAALAENERFTFHQADINRDPLPAERVDAIFHLACPASPIAYSRLPIETLEVSSVGTRRCLDLALGEEALFLLASTSEVYGNPEVHPQAETYPGNVDPVGPRSMYDEGKRFAEALATWFGRVHDLDVRIVRIFNTYGPRLSLQDGRAVPSFIRQALLGEPVTVHGDGVQSRSFCYISDLVEGLVRMSVVERGRINDLPVNLGNPVERSVLEIARTIVSLTDSASTIRHVERPRGDPDRRRPDITRARELLGWEPTVDLEQGLRMTIEWARSTIHDEPRQAPVERPSRSSRGDYGRGRSG